MTPAPSAAPPPAAPPVAAADATTGRFGPYGGRYAPETLVGPLEELAQAFDEARRDPAYLEDLRATLRDWVGRPTPITFAARLSERVGGGARVWLKREDLAHTGAHKVNNTVGQCLLARRMGKPRIIAETGAGQHGVATAAAAARLGLRCRVYMGVVDMERQALNVVRMRLLGAEVVGVSSGARTLKDAVNEAMRDWVTNVRDTHYVLGSALGPHPFPTMVRELQRVIGDEARAQVLEREGRLPDLVVACVGGGSNAIGLMKAFEGDAGTALVGVEAGGRGDALGEHAARFGPGGARVGVLHGTRTRVLCDDGGNVVDTHSISAGLDYPAVGPEHAWLAERGRARYVRARDEEALAAFEALSRLEGILPALESSHAVAWLLSEEGRAAAAGKLVLANLSGRGDKDVETVRRALEGRA